MLSPSHALCSVCRAATEVHTEDPLDTMCASCGSSLVELVSIVACPGVTGYTLPGERLASCALPFHDDQRGGVHVVPWEQRDMLLL